MADCVSPLEQPGSLGGNMSAPAFWSFLSPEGELVLDFVLGDVRVGQGVFDGLLPYLKCCC